MGERRQKPDDMNIFGPALFKKLINFMHSTSRNSFPVLKTVAPIRYPSHFMLKFYMGRGRNFIITTHIGITVASIISVAPMAHKSAQPYRVTSFFCRQQGIQRKLICKKILINFPPFGKKDKKPKRFSLLPL